MEFNYFISTGNIIKEYLDELGISQKELSERIGISEKHISNVLKGKSRLTEKFALKLEYIFKDIPASYWLNIESKYREYLARVESDDTLNKENLEDISKRFHFKEVFKGTNMSVLSQAKEMLEQLGYELQTQEQLQEQQETFNVIRYKCTTKNLYIDFYLDFELVAYHETIAYSLVGINMMELKAINKQVEELGWNKR